jgi:hypothetical protein
MPVNFASADHRFGFLIGDISRLAAHMERHGWIVGCGWPRDGRAYGVFRLPRDPAALARLSRWVAAMRQETFAGCPASSHEARFDDLPPFQRHLLPPDSHAQRSSFP